MDTEPGIFNKNVNTVVHYLIVHILNGESRLKGREVGVGGGGELGNCINLSGVKYTLW